MPIPGMTPAKRRYLFRFLSTIGAYIIVSLAILSYIVRFHPTGPILYVLAALPALPIVASIVVVGLCIAEEKDEFQRTLFEQSLLWGIGGTLASTSTWGI